jgi:uncharacterized protein
MKIGLISDTHGFLDEKVFHYFNECDEIWHAGDIGENRVYDRLSDFKKTRAVYGNIDGASLRTILPSDLIFEIEGMKIWITHIAGYPPRYTPGIKNKLKEILPDVLVCGHSHILRVMTDKKAGNLLYLNPGAAGIQGFHKIKTLIRFSVLKSKISDLQVIEMGKRSELD